MKADYLFIHLHATFVDTIWPLISTTIDVAFLDQQKNQVSTSEFHGSSIKKRINVFFGLKYSNV